MHGATMMAKVESASSSEDVCCTEGSLDGKCATLCSARKGEIHEDSMGNRSGEPQIRSAVTCSSKTCRDTCQSNVGEKPHGSSEGDVFRVCSKENDKVDLEKGGTGMEHVILSVQSLTCTGCETKLSRALHSIRGVYNLHTSLLLSRAEFDFDEKASTVNEVIKSVHKITGFVCHRLTMGGQEVDVIVDGHPKDFVRRDYPAGVIQMVATGKQTVRITYDPEVIGARSLIESFGRPLKLAAAPPKSTELESGKRQVRKMTRISIASHLLTIPVVAMAWIQSTPRPLSYSVASLVLATLMQVFIAGPFYPRAVKALLFTHVLETDLLIVLSTSAAYIFSVVSFVYEVRGQPLPEGEFFQTSTILVTLIILGRLVSAMARQKAIKSVSVRTLQEESAILITENGRHEEKIDVRLLQHDDIFKVMPDTRITTDGIIVSGITEVNESMITGESLPVTKAPGSKVIAGSLNGPGVIVVRLTHLPSRNTISTIAAMVDEAKFSKPKTQELVDLFAGYFVLIILALTFVTFTVWIAIGILVRRLSGGFAVANALTYAISVLVVSCPCAIGLVIPMVMVIAGGVAAKLGVVFKSAIAMETARKVSHVVFDKTGTLTEGKLSVVEELHLSEAPELAASIALGLTCNSKHPVASAISSYLKEKKVCAANVNNSQQITSGGIEGTLEGVNVRCGNPRWLLAEHQTQVQELQRKGLTIFTVAKDDQLLAVYGLSDTLRAESSLVVHQLQKRNIAVSIVSGDNAGAVNAVATQLKVPSTNVRSCCVPGDKQKYLQKLKADEGGVIIFCGDGTNDAVALAQADIGVHVSSGSDVAQAAADVVLLRPSLDGILVLLDVSKAAFKRIWVCFAWSFVYNLFAILLAAGAFVIARIPPQFAGIGEVVSVLPIFLIALQLKRLVLNYSED
jgi:Cd2+-exporting ATPase